tara:strand:- start:192 stop:2024 length:1833 start_codon:yes stop_codon:yes gene_type:complete
MNRYPIWKYILISIILFLGIIYTIPNFFGESPALQITSSKAANKLDINNMDIIKKILDEERIIFTKIFYENTGKKEAIRIKFVDTDSQFKAKSILEQFFKSKEKYKFISIAFNLLPNTPSWLQNLNALPMYLGLDLRGGVHFLMQVDTQTIIEKRISGFSLSVRKILMEKKVRFSGIDVKKNIILVNFRDQKKRENALEILANRFPELLFSDDDEKSKISISLTDDFLSQITQEAIEQNISTLSKRIDQLGVTEPIIQRQGADRIIIQLPGVQDVSRAKDIIGRTATLEVRLVNDKVNLNFDQNFVIPSDSELFTEGKSTPVVLFKSNVITGDYISSAGANFDQNQQPIVRIDLDGDGGRKMREATREKIGKPMAIVLFEKGIGEVLTVATIRDELGSQFQISGMESPSAASDLALLLRAGALAAPMEIIEERTIGPQLGLKNIKKGFNSTLYGFAAIAFFMMIYYVLFGAFSVIALSVNMMLLIGLLSVLQATLTLPGIAAIALTLGMAIDANVLINERIREELRNKSSPSMAISKGYERAWGTILDSNITTLIAGIALLTFGSGPIQGFAVVHCLGILTSMFSAVIVSRAIANLFYGRRKKLLKISIG